MAKRISSPPFGVNYPIWAWHLWEGSSNRPDMRKSSYAPRGTPIVRIKLDIPENEILLSDFDLWHYVLNHWYLASKVNYAFYSLAFSYFILTETKPYSCSYGSLKLII